jgi:predicted AAA+ superfamily ATPase
MYQMMETLLDQGVAPRNVLYVSFDNPIVKLISVEEVLDIYESLYPIAGDRYLFFDEIQYASNWELWMKVLYDTRKNIKLTATGSASPIIEKGAADSGAGRWTMLKVPTLSFYEYCALLQLSERPVLGNDIRLTQLVN